MGRVPVPHRREALPSQWDRQLGKFWGGRSPPQNLGYNWANHWFSKALLYPGHRMCYSRTHLLKVLPRTLGIQTSKPASARMNARLACRALFTQLALQSSSACCRSTAGFLQESIGLLQHRTDYGNAWLTQTCQQLGPGQTKGCTTLTQLADPCCQLSARKECDRLTANTRPVSALYVPLEDSPPEAPTLQRLCPVSWVNL